MYKVKDIITAREEVLEGTFQGVIQTHKIDAKEPRLENNPHEFLKITYPSSAIKRTIERVNEKLSGMSNQGGFLLVGPNRIKIVVLPESWGVNDELRTKLNEFYRGKNMAEHLHSRAT